MGEKTLPKELREGYGRSVDGGFQVDGNGGRLIIRGGSGHGTLTGTYKG